MKGLFLLCMGMSLFGAQLTNIVREAAVSCDTVRCLFSENAALVYNPGFLAKFAVPRTFKKKLFFCAAGSVTRECLKKKRDVVTNEYAVLFELVNVPVPGLLVLCAYDPQVIEFSWLKDTLGHAYVFYFNQKRRPVEYLDYDARAPYYAFYKYLPQNAAMC